MRLSRRNERPEPIHSPATASHRIRLLLLTCAFAVFLLLWNAADQHASFEHMFSDAVTAPLVEQVRASPVTMGRIYGFIVKVTILYLGLGVAAWMLTLLSLAALPRLLHRRHLLAAGWSAALALLVGLANADLFPWSRTGRWSRAVEDFLSAPMPLWTILAAFLCAVTGGLLLVWIRRRDMSRHALRGAIWTAVLLLVLVTVHRLPSSTDPIAAGATAARPNIVLIGIDSLRPDLVGGRGNIGYMPSLAAFADSGHRFTDATTPLARTFPSWMALLTGQRPVSNGVRENLVPRSRISVTTLPEMLGKQGYQTIYATDEVRFSNIDESYGFQSVVSPRIGATDFLLGSLGDVPLVNLLVNTVVGKWLFPDLHGNRAAAVTYDPSTFIARLDSDVRPDGRPVFLAMHLTLPHHPYRWRVENDVVFSSAADTAYDYLSAVVEVDRQFAGIMRLLETRGLLRNALVIAFSDHGEGLNLHDETGVLFNAARAGIEGLPVWSAGHGNTVLSAAQFQIFMAARSYGLDGYGESRGIHDVPVSIEDIASTVLEVVRLPASNGLDGQSFAPFLDAHREKHARGSMRIRFTESAFTSSSLQRGAVDEVSIMKENAGLFEVNPVSGWVEASETFLNRSMRMRERAAIGPSLILAAVPGPVPGRSRFLLMSRAGGEVHRLASRPEGMGQEATWLWDALAREFSGELGSPMP